MGRVLLLGRCVDVPRETEILEHRSEARVRLDVLLHLDPRRVGDLDLASRMSLFKELHRIVEGDYVALNVKGLVGQFGGSKSGEDVSQEAADVVASGERDLSHSQSALIDWNSGESQAHRILALAEDGRLSVREVKAQNTAVARSARP